MKCPICSKEITKDYSKCTLRLKKLEVDARRELLEKDIKWLQSCLDTKHICKGCEWVIEGRISKLKEEWKEVFGLE